MKKLTTTSVISLLASVTFSASFSTPTWAHGQHVNTQPWVVCAEAKRDDTCQYVVASNQLYKGTCQAMSDALMCVRNQPIEMIEMISGQDSTFEVISATDSTKITSKTNTKANTNTDSHARSHVHLHEHGESKRDQP